LPKDVKCAYSVKRTFPHPSSRLPREVEFEAEARRRREAQGGEEGQEIALRPIDLGLHLLDSQTLQVEHQLPQERRRHLAVTAVQIDPDRVQDGDRWEAKLAMAGDPSGIRPGPSTSPPEMQRSITQRGLD
jgi:hypothetical protein